MKFAKSGSTPPEELAQPVLQEQEQIQNIMEVSLEPTGRPKRQCRQNINYTDNDIDMILEQHLLENARARKRKDPNENEAEVVQKKRGRQAKSKTSAKSTKEDTSSQPQGKGSVNGPSTSTATSSVHNINDQQRQALLASINHIEYDMKFMNVDRLHFEMQTRDEAHLNPDFRKSLVDEWVSTNYDHEFHFKRLLELINTQDQKYSDSILHTVFIMKGLLNVKNENNLLKLKMEDMMKNQPKSGSSSNNGSV